MTLKDLVNKKILMVGYGKEGKATEEFLKKCVPNSVIEVVDQSHGEGYLAKQERCDIAIKSPGVHADLIKIPYTTATNIFFSEVKGMVIGVTGTKGKSTTASLMYSILLAAGKRVHLVGNIGNPMLSELLVSNTQEDIWVCELSSYQLSDIQYSPHISVFVSLFPEHMNYHGSIEAYYKAKAQIVAQAKSDDYIVYNPEVSEIVHMIEKSPVQKVPYIHTLPFSENIIPLLGKHNVSNVKAAVTVAKLLDISDEVLTKAIENFQPLRHRLQNVGTYKNITFYDDAISTTPESTLAALAALPQVGTLMLGGEDRGYDFTRLVEALVTYKIPNVVLFPESGEKMRKELEKQAVYHPRVLQTSSMTDAVDFAYQNTPQGMICLLSTASPSYTIWKNFEEKGDEFQQLVREMGKFE